MVKRVNKAQQVREYLKAKPEATTAEIAKKFKVASTYVYQVRAKMKVAAEQDRKWQPPEMIPMPDVVNHPPHYKTGGIETIDFIEAKELGYHLGNVIKYVSRAKHKGNELEDLKKAQWYLERAIMNLHI